NLAIHGGLTQLVTTEAEFAIHTARTAGDFAAIAHPRGACVTRQRLQRKARFVTLFVGLRLVVDDRLEGGALGGEFLHRLGTLHLAIDQGELRHLFTSVAEREVEGRQQRLGFLVGLGRRRDADVQPSHGVDLVVFDLGEDDLFLHADVVVAPAIEGPARYAAEVTHPRERDRDQAVEELVHPLAAQGDHASDRIAFADLETGDRLAG